ncbi:hypothetical protein [Devosia sp. SD17-2]|uniref:hypothetical protein n=1 Tax=Devosia sp. SD17-2 TaxID=2976459 RepID=UPI0023D7D862|nr:hypothetical protein [Devosia sp. SD17-2]WEJ32930.1 hypothetical protein NYQ88_18960 [Devosia sp. SD17-2]
MPRLNESEDNLRFVVIAAGLVAAAVLTSLLARKVIAADGAWYVMSIALEGDFFLVGWHRNFAQIANQIIPVTYRRFFDASLSVVEFLYSLNIFICFAFSVLLSAHLCRSSFHSYFVFCFSLLVVSLFSDYIIMGEHQILMLFAWPILLFAVYPSASRLVQILILFCAVVVLRCYETAAVILMLPLVVSVFRIVRPGQRGQVGLPYWIVLAALLCCGVALGAHGILFPRDAGNMSGFAQSALIPLQKPIVWASLVLLVPFVLAVVLSHRLLAFGTAAAGVLVLTWVWWTGGVPDSWQSFSGRSLTLTILPALMAICVAIGKWGRPVDPQIAVSGLILIAGFVGVSAASQLSWYSALQNLEDRLSTHSGLQEYGQAGLDNEEFFPYWTLPTLSILMQPDCVDSVVLVPDGHPWQPFDPHLALPELYGVTYGTALGGNGCPE